MAWPFQRGALIQEYLPPSSICSMLVRGALGVLAQLVVGRGFAVPGMQALARGATLVLEPGVVDEFLDLVGIAQVHFMHLAQVAIDDGARAAA
jgi:hypothetical protein